MADNSNIEWTDHTANFWWGCIKVHAGCDNCYAEALSKRFGENIWGRGSSRKFIKSTTKNLDKYQRQAEKEGRQVKVFVGSMMDIFEKSMPLVGCIMSVVKDTGLVRDYFFDCIDNGRWDGLTFLLLTKRPSNINKMIPEGWKLNPPSNVYFGCSPVDQKTFDTLVPQLLNVNGHKFLSIEPQLGDIDLSSVGSDIMGIDWIIQGGESGPNRRPFDLKWAESMRRQCDLANIPYFFKQIDKVKPIPPEYKKREFPSFEKKN